MPELSFEIISAEVKPFAAIPTLAFKLKIINETGGEEIYAAGLKCQVLIEATKRKYDDETKEKLKEVFGEPARWEETVRGLFWTTLNLPVPRFESETTVDLIIGCAEDHLAACGKYFYSVKDGEIPLAFLFSGTLFYKNSDGQLQITQVPWHKEALYRMPTALWKEMMKSYFPNSRWLRLSNDVFDKLYKCKTLGSFITLEDCLDSLLNEALEKLNEPFKEIV